MHDAGPLLLSQIVVRVCLFLAAAIPMFGGALQFFLGQPETAPRLDNVHRFMAGVYFSTGLICLWAGITIRQQGTLVYLLALGMLYDRVAGILWLHRFIDGVAAAAIGLTIMVGIRASRRVERRLGPVTILLLLFFTVGVLRWPMVPVVICVTPASLLLAWLSEERPDA